MLKIESKEENGWMIVSMVGEIDLHSSPDVRKELSGPIKAKKIRIALDMTDVSYIDSSGMATFIEAMQKLKKSGGEMVLFGLSETVMHVFEVAMLDSVFKILKRKEDLLT